MKKANNDKSKKVGKKPVHKETKRNKELRYTPKGRIYLSATFNNTLITVTDEQGRTICWGSCGKSGFSGTRKSTPYAATTAIESVLNDAQNKHGLAEVAVYIKGAGPGRDSLLRVLRNSKLEVSKLVDVTPIPHDGIRPKKRRRV